MANPIADAWIRMRASTAGFQQETQSGVMGAARKIAATVGGVFAAEKVFDFGKQAVDEAANVQKAQEAIRFEYGKSGKTITDFATGAAASLGLSTATSEQSAASFGILFKNIGVAPPRAAAMTVGFQRLAGSLSLIKNVNPATSLDALTTAIAGNTRGLRGLGIVVTPAAEALYAAQHGIVNVSAAVHAAAEKAKLAQDAYTQAVDKYGKSSSQAQKAQLSFKSAQDAVSKAMQGAGVHLTSAQKAEAIYGLSTQHLAEYQREAHKSSGDLTDQMEILRAKLDNVRLEIGQRLLPVVQGLVDFLIGHSGTIAQFAAGFLVFGAVFATLKGGVAAAREAMTLYGKAVEQAAAIQRLFTASEEESDAAMAANPIGLIITALALLAVAIYEAYQHWKPFRDAVNAAWRDVQQAAGGIISAIAGLSPQFHAVLNAVRGIIMGFVGVVQALWGRFGSTIVSSARIWWNTAKAVIQAAILVIRGILNVVLGLIHGDWGRVWEGIKQIVHGVWDGIVAYLRGMVGIMLNVALAIGQAILNGIVHFVESIPGRVSDYFHSVVSAISGLIGAAASAAASLAKGIWNAIVNGISGLPGKVLGLIQQIPQQLGNLDRLLYNAGVQIVSGLLGGLTSKFNDVKNTVSSWAGSIASLKGPLDRDRQLLVPHGLAITAGLHEGLTRGFADVQRLTAGVAPAISRAMAGGAGATLAAGGGGPLIGSGEQYVFNGPVSFQTSAALPGSGDELRAVVRRLRR